MSTMLPMQCQTCQLPLLFTEPGDPSRTGHREMTIGGMRYHFCSVHCREIFAGEPDKYRQALLSSNRLHQGDGNLVNAGADQAANDPQAASLAFNQIRAGHDNGDFENSIDQQNFREWRGTAEQGA